MLDFEQNSHTCFHAEMNQYNGKGHCTKMNASTTMMNLPKIIYPRAYSMILLLICYYHSQIEEPTNYHFY